MQTPLAQPAGVTICADDYGLAPGVSRAIRSLVGLGRLSAVSCMTGFPEWPTEARRLKDLDADVDIGLHLVLSDLPATGTMPRTAPGGRLPGLARLLVDSHLGMLALAEIEEEMNRQLDAFEASMGRRPDFIDGHRHVHSLPGVRNLVVALFETRLDKRNTWLRVCSSSRREIIGRGHSGGHALPQALLIDQLSRPLSRLAEANGIHSNDGFRGVNRFDTTRFASLFETWMSGTGSRPLIMCHPGFVDAALRDRDSVTAARGFEYDFLASDDFLKLLDRYGQHLQRLPWPDSDRSVFRS